MGKMKMAHQTLKMEIRITFSVAITNTSNVDIPEGVTIGFKVVVDGTTTYRNQKFKDGLKSRTDS